jgi:hypothetical protein
LEKQPPPTPPKEGRKKGMPVREREVECFNLESMIIEKLVRMPNS